MTIRVAAAGWTGRAVTRAMLGVSDMTPAGALARSTAGRDIGTVVSVGEVDVALAATLEDASKTSSDVVADYTKADVAKPHMLLAIRKVLDVEDFVRGLDNLID